MSQLNGLEKEYIHKLYNSLCEKEEQSVEVLDILDVLRQVYVKLDEEKKPEFLVNRLVQYIRSVSLEGRLHYTKEEEQLMMNLSKIGQKAGINGLYRGNYGDKSQFYSCFDQEKMIYRR